MSEQDRFFDGWSTQRKVGFGLSILVCFGLVLGLAWWASHTPKAVLFSDLADRDAAVLLAELDRLKQPYSLSEDGHSILVAADTVHKTRMAVMAKQLPLHGAVGFELFNNTDFGVSDFVQKVNYQRALQGELTRTILAIDQVQDARVHLALPDQTLFRKDVDKAKASVTVMLKGGQALYAAQVAGIQRLVAASVPEITAEGVTVLDQHGVVLSKGSGEDVTVASGQLDARQDMEAHLTRKATKLLDRLFQAGEAMVTVDAVINHEQSRIITEEVLAAARAPQGERATGVVSRERSISKDSSSEQAAGAGTAPQVVTQETDYQNGKRVAQTVSLGGQLSRLSVAVVVKRKLGEVELARVRDLMASAVGLVPSRGDNISVHSMAEFSAQPRAEASSVVAERYAATDQAHPAAAQRAAQVKASTSARAVEVLTGVMLLVVLGALAAWTCRRHPAAKPASLSDAERDALLVTLNGWLKPGAPAS